MVNWNANTRPWQLSFFMIMHRIGLVVSCMIFLAGAFGFGGFGAQENRLIVVISYGIGTAVLAVMLRLMRRRRRAGWHLGLALVLATGLKDLIGILLAFQPGQLIVVLVKVIYLYCLLCRPTREHFTTGVDLELK